MILILECFFAALIVGIVLTYVLALIWDLCECLCGSICSFARFIKRTICERKNETEKKPTEPQRPMFSTINDSYIIPSRTPQQPIKQRLTFREAYTIMEEELKLLGVGNEVKRQRGKCCYGWSGRESAVVFDYKNGRVMEKTCRYLPRFAFNEHQMKNIAEIFAITCSTSDPFTDLRFTDLRV